MLWALTKRVHSKKQLQFRTTMAESVKRTDFARNRAIHAKNGGYYILEDSFYMKRGRLKIQIFPNLKPISCLNRDEVL
jgi:hypothetical protein